MFTHEPFWVRLKKLWVRLKKVSEGTLGWIWAIGVAVILLCALPWFEFANLKYIGFTIAAVVLLTLTGLGPNYFAARSKSGRVKVLLNWLVQRSRASAKLLAQTVGILTIVSIIVPGLGIYITVGAFALGDKLFKPFKILRSELETQLLFQRGSASVQLRLESAGDTYKLPKYQTVVVCPLSPFINVLTELPPDQPDSTWVVVNTPTPPLTKLLADTKEWQTSLLKQALVYRQEIAEQRNREVIEAARVFNTLYFELDTHSYSLDGPRAGRSERHPLPDSLSSPSLYARLSPDSVMWVRASVEHGTDSESFSFALTGFGKRASYQLGTPPPDDAPTLLGRGYAEIRLYEQGSVVAYVSTSDSPVQVAITCHDAAQRVIAGTFSGLLRAPNGQTVTVEEGRFEVRYR
ncbi:MAG: hypothetical protein M3Y54_07275 [Bacteroidota bacterium]|nr:hypothetical protein [Bacteroidota bacterium]